MEQQSPELVLVAPLQDRAAALAALPNTTAIVPPLADEPPVPDETAVALPRHADLGRSRSLADEPEQDRRGLRLAWWTAVTAAVTVGAAAPVVRNHIRALLRALGAHSRLEALAVARRHGLLP